MASAATTRRAKKRPVRRPVQARARATREAILDAAAQLLSRGGLRGLTTNHVAARAGVSIGTLYEYFRDKNALTEALLDRHLSAAEAAFERVHAGLVPVAAELPLRDVVRLLVDAMVTLHAADPALHRVLATELSHSEAVVTRVRALEAKIVTTLARIIAARGDVRVRSPRLAAKVCVHTADALTHRWVVDDEASPAAASRLTSELTDLLVRYLEA